MKADLGKKRGQGKVLEIAAKSCKKITVFMDSQSHWVGPSGGGRHTAKEE